MCFLFVVGVWVGGAKSVVWILILFIFRNWGRATLAVTDAKVMTFTAAKCEHNLPQTSLLVGKVIPSNQKKKIGCG
jgi:hypothetical protein